MLTEKINNLASILLNASNQKTTWLTNEDVMKLLDISKSTLQNYRDKGIIPFYQQGRKILYKSTEVDSFIEGFKVNSFRK